jgi:phage gpG-like protein
MISIGTWQNETKAKIERASSIIFILADDVRKVIRLGRDKRGAFAPPKYRIGVALNRTGRLANAVRAIANPNLPYIEVNVEYAAPLIAGNTKLQSVRQYSRNGRAVTAHNRQQNLPRRNFFNKARLAKSFKRLLINLLNK